jgi:hypothetical protein
MDEGVDLAMSSAERSLEERSLLMARFAAQLKQHNHHAEATRMMAASDRARRHAEAVRELMREPDSVPTTNQ